MSIPMFLNPSRIVSQRKVRKDVTAYKYASGVIIINDQTYMFYSMTDAIAKWRRDNPIN
jgi:DNA-binding transcriptional MocR family regulator